MGRVRVNMKRVECNSNRQVTYCKRRSGIVKKAQEICVLCDIDIILLMFSPNGKPTLFHGGPRLRLALWQVPQTCTSGIGHVKVKVSDLAYALLNTYNSNFDEIIAKFAQLTPQERAKRKLESLETLRKTFKKLDNDIGVQEFLDASDPSVEELHNQVKVLQSRFTDVEMRLNWWSNPDKINKVEDFALMECALRESLKAVHVQKLQNTAHLQLLMNSELDGQTYPWHPANKIQHMPFPQAPNILPHENMGYSRDTSVAESSHVMESGKVEQARQATTAILDDNSVLNDPNSVAFLRQQLSEQYSYNPNDNLDLLERKILDPQSDVNLKGYLMDYEFQRNFNLTRSVDSVNNNAADAVAVADFDEKSYPRQATSSD